MKLLLARRLLLGLALASLVTEPMTVGLAQSIPSGSLGPLMTTPTGLKYQDIVVGTGVVPKVGSHVTVKYEGKLLDGTVFDASEKHGGTFDYVQGETQLIAGWTEGVSTMKEGGKRKLIIPPELGYGQGGMPGVIPPNATLVFTIELVKVQ
jgi:peptidylprolyl isomerase